MGASALEDYGNYYAWGETTPKNVYSWSTYAFGNDDGKLTKYCNKASYGLNGFTDNQTILQASDDAATANLGGGARTPTKNEWEELIDYTTSIWIVLNGVNGHLLTGSNGKSLFLPAAGAPFGPSIDGTGEFGFYWSSALYLDYPGLAWAFGFSSGREGMYASASYRYEGYPVRAVRASQH